MNYFLFSQQRKALELEALVAPGHCGSRPQVEVWLNRVMDRMCATLRHEIPEAVVTYEEKPREQWIFDYPAQVRGTGTPGLRGGAGSPRSAAWRLLRGASGGWMAHCGWRGPSASRWRSRALRFGGPRRWAWHLRGWRKDTRTLSKITTKSRCVGPRDPTKRREHQGRLQVCASWSRRLCPSEPRGSAQGLPLWKSTASISCLEITTCYHELFTFLKDSWLEIYKLHRIFKWMKEKLPITHHQM